MRPAVRIDRAARGVIGVLGEGRACAIFGNGDRQCGMALMRLVQHRAKIIEFSGVPAKIPVVADCIGNSDNGVAGRNAGNRSTRGFRVRRDALFAAVGKCREPAWSSCLASRSSDFQQGRRSARALVSVAVRSSSLAIDQTAIEGWL